MIVGILLAAGRSSRFGSQKLLHPMPGNGEPMVLRSALTLIHAVDRLIAVVSPLQRSVADALAGWPVEVCFCDEAAQGMGASVACGVRAAAGSGAVVVALADMPFVLPSTAAAVVRAMRGGAAIAAPVHEGRRGHPVGFNRAYYPQLTTLSGDCGAKPILQEHRERTSLLPVDDPGVHRDVDVREDL